MKARKLILAAALALCMGAGASAQDEWEFGVKGALSLNTMPWTTLDVGDRQTVNLGFYAGGYTAVHVSDHCLLEADLMYARKGVSTKSEVQGNYTRNIGYVQLPVYVGWDVTGRNNLRVMTGPGLGIYLADDVSYSSLGEHPSSVGNQCQPFNLFWALQGHYAITDNLLFEIRADIGLTRTFKTGGLLTDDKGRNATVSFGLCYRFGY